MQALPPFLLILHLWPPSALHMPLWSHYGHSTPYFHGYLKCPILISKGSESAQWSSFVTLSSPWYVPSHFSSCPPFPDQFLSLSTSAVILLVTYHHSSNKLSFSCLIYDAQPWVECKPTKAECNQTSDTQHQRGKLNPYAKPSCLLDITKDITRECIAVTERFHAGRISKAEDFMELYKSIPGWSEYDPFIRALDP